MSFKSVLTPEGSVVAGLATVGLVAAVYQLDIGPVSSVHMTPAYDQAAGASIKKAGWTMLARDPNIAILGGAAIIAMHAHYRHAHMADDQTGQLVPPGPQAYQPAQNIVPAAMQAQTG